MLLTMLQQRTAQVPQFNSGDVTSMFTALTNAVNAVLAPAVHLASFIAVVWLIWEFFKAMRKKQQLSKLEIIGFALVLVLMR